MHHSNIEPSNGFTFGDFFRSAIGVSTYLLTSPNLHAESYTHLNIEEGIRAAYSICIAITILVASYIVRGILEDKEAWLTIKLDAIKNFLKFKKKISIPSNKDIEDDLLEDLTK